MTGSRGAPPFAMQGRIFNTMAERVKRHIVLARLFSIFPWRYDQLHTLQAGWLQEGIAIIAPVGQPQFRTKAANQAERRCTLCKGTCRNKCLDRYIV
ncbi:MAG: hypothetical protein CSA09_05510 [Candidatus Contendobacter odensis]|uniref:Uncharacterized protein n=1 Tax=Candidatus Contendibacter odensensis TaxID=1400860 RepID=A0A2G6PDV5_9GAMM|nr:MAG: hypothetical protein CSA09_05510 [Candidatus Contendobacter odensis]